MAYVLLGRATCERHGISNTLIPGPHRCCHHGGSEQAYHYSARCYVYGIARFYSLGLVLAACESRPPVFLRFSSDLEKKQKPVAYDLKLNRAVVFDISSKLVNQLVA